MEVVKRCSKISTSGVNNNVTTAHPHVEFPPKCGTLNNSLLPANFCWFFFHCNHTHLVHWVCHCVRQISLSDLFCQPDADEPSKDLSNYWVWNGWYNRHTKTSVPHTTNLKKNFFKCKGKCIIYLFITYNNNKKSLYLIITHFCISLCFYCVMIVTCLST